MNPSDRPTNPSTGIFQDAATVSPSPRGRVALLGIAHRHIRITLAPKLGQQKQHISLNVNEKTLGGWIQAKRTERNLTPGHLAAKMGIAQAVVRSWEEGSRQPDGLQLAVLERIFGVRWENVCHAPNAVMSNP